MFFFIPSAKIDVALPFPSSFLQFTLVLIFQDSPSFSILIQHQKLLFFSSVAISEGGSFLKAETSYGLVNSYFFPVAFS